MTKDEQFLLKLHELAEKSGDPFAPIDRFVIGRGIGQNDKGLNTIINTLAQTNFIKKGENDKVALTAHGLNLVYRLKNEYHL